MNKRNVFSNDAESINLLIHSKSFADSIEDMSYFINANKLANINVFFMPLLGNESSHILDLKMGKYKHYTEYNMLCTSIEFNNYSGIIYVENRDCTKDETAHLDSLAEQKILRGDIHCDYFDYIVCNDMFIEEKTRNKKVITYRECKEILRLFLINRQEFFVTENIKCDETFYYIYYHKVLFSEFQNFWKESVNHKGDSWADALDNRLQLISMCLDNIKIEIYKTQNNLTVMHLKYHLSYLLLLVTGTFDNLAWLINNLYKLELEKKSRLKIDLLKEEYKKKVREKSEQLDIIISDDNIQKRIEAIRELRDRIIHRDFVQMATSDRKNSLIILDEVSTKKLVNASFPQEGIIIYSGMRNFIDIMDFTVFVQNTIVGIVNDILNVISKEIYNSEESYEIWRLLQLPCEPYVL